MIIGVDLDGVLADFTKQVEQRLKELGIPLVPPEQIKEFYFIPNYPKKYHEIIRSIYNEAGFFLGLPAIAGGVEALLEMEKRGHTVFICSSPLSSNPTCADDKIKWVAKTIGESWRKRVMLVNDKTLAQCDILIDDKPEISGRLKPSWEHVVFSQPYNQETDKRTITWENWDKVLQI